MIDKFQALRDIDTDNEEIRGFTTRIKRYKQEIQRLQDETFKNDYRLGKFREEIATIESEIKQREYDITKIAEKSNIEWFRNKWMNNTITNKLEEIRYWCS